jgi:hypothetical protein
MYNEYYKIPNYQNKYHTEYLLVICRSEILGAVLGLFAFVPLETRMLPENKRKWIKIDRKLRSTAKSLATNKYRVFKGMTPLKKISTYIDEYRGEHVIAKTSKELNKILDRTRTGRAFHDSKTFAIDSRNPTDCYAQYANDSRRKKGLHYNAKLISHPPTKSAAIIAILDIFVDDEIYVDYGAGYWANQPTVSTEENEEE